MSYSVERPENDAYVTQLMSKPNLISINGTKSHIAKYDNTTNAINIYTESEEDVHMHQVILRDCTKGELQRLIELNLYIKVLTNTYPSPVVDIQTMFTLNVGDVVRYTIPRLIDPEGNDIPQVYVGLMTG